MDTHPSANLAYAGLLSYGVPVDIQDVEPSQIVVQILGCDPAEVPNKILELTVIGVHVLNAESVYGVPPGVNLDDVDAGILGKLDIAGVFVGTEQGIIGNMTTQHLGNIVRTRPTQGADL